MKHKRGLLAICLIICLFSIATVSASDISDGILADNNDLIENESTITEILSANPDGTFTDLANEIASATDELNLTRNYRYAGDSSYKKGILINKSIVINGNGFTINGNNQARMFKISSSNVTLSNICFVNCYASSFGGAINWEGNYTTITNCSFTNFNSDLDGGAIFGEGNYNTITNCSFKNSRTCGIGGAIYLDGNYNAITNCSFKNFRIDGVGGSIFLFGDYGTAANCSFTNSNAKYGGAIYWWGNNGTITNCNFINTVSSYEGGAIWVTGGDITMTNNIFINTTSEKGHAISWEGGNGTIKNNTFINASSKNIYKTIVWNCEYGKITITDCNFTYSEYGCPLWIEGCNPDVIITDCNFKNHKVPTSGLVTGIVLSNVTAKISNCNFTNIVSNKHYLAAIQMNGVDVTITNCNFISSVKSMSSQIGLDDDYIYRTSNAIITNCKFINSYRYSKTENMNGGAIEFVGDNLIVINCSFINFTAINGGAISVQPSADEVNCTISNCNFTNCTAKECGGAIWSTPYSSVVNCTFANNVAGIYGGATYYCEVIDCIFKGNTGTGKNDMYPKLATVLTARYDNTTKNIVAVVKDTDGNPLSGIKVGFAYNGVKYVLTDVNGQALFSTRSVGGGNTTVKVMAYGNHTYDNSNQEIVTVTKEQAKIYLRNALYFVLETKYVTVTLWDANNNPLVGKTVYINLDEYGLKYSGVTDENGNAVIRVGVGFGNHPATVSFGGDDIYGSCSKTGRVRVIKETPSLMLPGVFTKFNATNKTKTIKVYLWDRTSKPLLPETKVFVTINGRQYVGSLDSEGIASININLNKAGVYNVDLYYTGNTAYNAVRKTTRITIV